jgi:hypothetical protein
MPKEYGKWEAAYRRYQLWLKQGLWQRILGPHNVPLERENPNLLVSPTTDAGTVPNLKWPFALSHNRVLSGGWARETTTRELPISTEGAGVDMRMKPGAMRELHWHAGYVASRGDCVRSHRSSGSCGRDCLPGNRAALRDVRR